MGRAQHRVRNNSSESLLPLEDVCPLWAPCWCWAVRFHSRGGREDEQARQSGAVVVLEFGFRDISLSFDYFLSGAYDWVRPKEESALSAGAAVTLPIVDHEQHAPYAPLIYHFLIDGIKYLTHTKCH
jgi:hypothetical protein